VKFLVEVEHELQVTDKPYLIGSNYKYGDVMKF